MTTGTIAQTRKTIRTSGQPSTLLSICRKILTIIMLNRIWDRIEKQIPKEQSAYQPGRGTTEQVLAVKILCDKAITTTDFKIYLQLIAMSKAFDTVNRKLLFQHLENILEKDELHILSILTNRPSLSVKIGKEKGEQFQTYQCIMQGDCLSAILFIYYFAMSMKDENKKPPETFEIYPTYADDRTIITTEYNRIETIYKYTTAKLNIIYNVTIVKPKTTKYLDPSH